MNSSFLLNLGCFSQFVPDNVINSLSYSITEAFFVSDTRLFPDIRFTCHGIITNWIVIAASQNNSVIKIRRSNNLTTTALSVNISNAVMISSLLYNFTMSNEIAVQPGDVLMIESNSTNFMLYQQYNGPHNYRLDNNNESIALDSNDYPLISVVIGKNNFYFVINFFQCHIEPSITTSTTPLYTACSHINTLFASSSSYAFYSTPAVKMESTEYQQTSATTSLNNIPIVTFSTSTTSMMSTPVSTSQSTGSNALMIAAVISAVFILLVVTILVILIVSVLVYRRRWHKTSNGNDTFSSDERKANTNQQSDGNVH